jgi:hypothetical protein
MLYGLTSNVNGSILGRDDIIDVVKYIKGNLKQQDPSKVYDINVSAGKSLVLLSYVSSRMKFFNKKRLDYSAYPYMKTVCKVLLNFTSSSTVNVDNVKLVNKIIVILSKIDERFVQYRYGLGYRYLRIFIIMILYGNYTNAAVVADFILNQIIVKR